MEGAGHRDLNPDIQRMKDVLFLPNEAEKVLAFLLLIHLSVLRCNQNERDDGDHLVQEAFIPLDCQVEEQSSHVSYVANIISISVDESLHFLFVECFLGSEIRSCWRLDF
jgi:hypothetical protein